MNLMVQRLDEPDQLAAVLKEAGFRDVEVRSEVDPRTFVDEEDWWARVKASPVVQDALASLGSERTEQFRAEAFEHLRALRGPAGIPLRVEALFGLARNP